MTLSDPRSVYSSSQAALPAPTVEELASALAALCDAIDRHVQRRVLLDKRQRERRVQYVVRALHIRHEYGRARKLLDRVSV